jgi:predicted MFS family arabinose efflux permease
MFGWRNVFFILAGLFAIATAALYFELFRNPITHAGHASASRSRGFFKDYATVLKSPWARALIVMAFIEAACVFGAFTYVGADLHLRFGVSFTMVGLFVGAFAVGGLIYSLSVRVLVNRLGQAGLAATGGTILACAFVALAFQPHAYFAPFAIVGIGLGFYMLHNTLQTNATQVTPEARGTALGAFSSALYLGQTLGVFVNSIIFDRFGAIPVFLTAALILVALGLWFSRALRQRALQGA